MSKYNFYKLKKDELIGKYILSRKGVKCHLKLWDRLHGKM